MDVGDWSFIPEPPSVPVTALLNLGDVLLSGEGSFLHLYCLNQAKKYFLKVFTSANIHGIAKNNLETNVHQLFVFGGRFYCIITLDLSFKVLEMSREMQVAYWISDCCWVSYKSKDDCSCCSGFVLFFSNNTLALHDFNSLRNIGTVGCEESCILYSAKVLFQPEWGGVVAMGGTVFNQVVIWSTDMSSFFCEETKPQPVLHRLTGHKGVILGLDWNPDRKELCSVSDDRSIQIQKMLLDGEFGDVGEFEAWKKCKFQPGLVLFGHTARVWRSKLLANVIVSIAEDATCAVWNYDGDMLQKFVGHRGKNIFSLEVNESKNEIYTGGSDGSIRTWKFEIQSVSRISTPSEDVVVVNPPVVQDKDFPRTIRLIDSKLLVMMEMGSLVMFESESKLWSTLMTSTKYSSYCLLEVNRDIVAVANIHGWILLLQINGNSSSILLEENLFDGKIFSILWLSETHLLATGPNGDVVVCKIESSESKSSLVVVSKYALPPANQRWVTSAAILEGSKVIVCGDRVGSIHVYNFPASNQEPSNPVKTFPKVFGHYGVTHVCRHGDQVYCCGRNGRIHIYKGGSADEFNVVHVFEAYKGFDWLSKIIFTSESQFVIGFLSDKFVMFDISNNRFLLSFPCGGGHRTWDFKVSNSTSKLAFIKKRQIVLHQNNFKASNSLIKPSLYGLALTSILHLNSTSSSNGFVDTFAVGGEDGLINFTSFLSQDCCIKTGVSWMQEDVSDVKVTTVKGHTTGLKAMSVMNTSVDNEFMSSLLFTAGAGGIIKAWDLKIPQNYCGFTSNDISSGKIQTSCDEPKVLETQNGIHNSLKEGVLLKQLHEHVLCSKYRKGRKPWRNYEVNEMLEARYMTLDVLPLPKYFMGHALDSEDFALVVAGCSLGFVRTFMFNRRTNRFDLLKEFDFHEHCILKVKHHLHRINEDEASLWLLSTATDGRVAFWDITDDVTNFLQNNSGCKDSTEPSFTYQSHQAGINALDITVMKGEGNLLLSTGGDDNSIGLAVFNIPSSRITRHNKHLTAHSSQVTGVKLLSDEYLLSVSIDQRLILWRVGEDLQLEMIQSIMVDICDISDMLVTKYSEKLSRVSYGITVIGKGVQRIRLNLEHPNKGCENDSTEFVKH